MTNKDFRVDTHTHTLVSGHAYNTMKEMITAAYEKEAQVLCITEHGPAMAGAPHPYYFTNLRSLPTNKNQVPYIYHGMEANIVDYSGNTDYDTLGDNIDNIKFIIASYHTVCLEPGTVKQNTEAYIGAMMKPYVSVLGHIDDGRIPCDYEEIIKAAKINNCLIEINNSSNNSATFRINSKENTLEYLQLCKENEVMISLGSDAHCDSNILNFSNIIPLLNQLNFPKDLIINATPGGFVKFVEDKYAKRLALKNI